MAVFKSPDPYLPVIAPSFLPASTHHTPICGMVKGDTTVTPLCADQHQGGEFLVHLSVPVPQEGATLCWAVAAGFSAYDDGRNRKLPVTSPRNLIIAIKTLRYPHASCSLIRVVQGTRLTREDSLSARSIAWTCLVIMSHYNNDFVDDQSWWRAPR